jgi:hypothetical protein
LLILKSNILYMVNFVNIQFGVSNGNALEYSDIEKYFATPKTENDHIEFKSYGSDKNLPEKIYKTICGMLNSDGGLVIWGAPKEQKNANGERECVGELQPVTVHISPDDLIRTISDSIIPTPRGIQIFPVSNNDSTKTVFVVQVQKSEYRPHQTANAYYMRLDRQTKHAPHHYVEALFKQIKYPDLRGKIEFLNVKFASQSQKHIRLDFSVSVTNNSPFQNEEYPEYRVYTSEGKLFEWYMKNWPDPEPPIYTNSNARPMVILHYSETTGRNFRLGLTTEPVRRAGGIIKLSLVFGGRFAPLKITSYEINLSEFREDRFIEMADYKLSSNWIKLVSENIMKIDSDIDLNSFSDSIDSW